MHCLCCSECNLHQSQSVRYFLSYILLFLSQNQPGTPMSQIYFTLNKSTCFGQSFGQLSGVDDCKYNNRHMSNRYCYCLLAWTGWNSTCYCLLAGTRRNSICHCLIAGKRRKSISFPLASRQHYLSDICLLLYVQSWTPDDGRNDRPKHVELFQTKINLIHWCIWLVLL